MPQRILTFERRYRDVGGDVYQEIWTSYLGDQRFRLTHTLTECLESICDELGCKLVDFTISSDGRWGNLAYYKKTVASLYFGASAIGWDLSP